MKHADSRSPERLPVCSQLEVVSGGQVESRANRIASLEMRPLIDRLESPGNILRAPCDPFDVLLRSAFLSVYRLRACSVSSLRSRAALR